MNSSLLSRQLSLPAYSRSPSQAPLSPLLPLPPPSSCFLFPPLHSLFISCIPFSFLILNLFYLRQLSGAEPMDAEPASPADHLPPPPPLPQGERPTVAPGYEHHNGSSSQVGPSHSADIPDPAPGPAPGGHAGERGSSALVALRPTLPAPKQAVRPGYGRGGRTVDLCVNHFQARVTNWEDVFHYNVTIEPAVLNKKICRDVMKKLRDTYGEKEFGGKRGAYDGEKSLFTSGSLNFNRQEFPVFLDDERGPSFKPGDRSGKFRDSPPASSPPQGSPGSASEQGLISKRRRTRGRGRDFVVTIEFAAKVRMKAIDDMLKGQPGAQDRALDALRVLDIVLRENASNRGYLLVRDNFFHPTLGTPGNLGEGVEVWRGFHSSIRPTGLGLTLNLDITMTTVLKPIMVEDFLKETFNVRDIRQMQHKQWSKAKNLLKNVQIETTHMTVSRTHKIAGFSSEECGQLKFTKKTKDGQGNIIGEEEIYVEQYYFDVYKLRLQYPQLPALDVGSRKKPTFIPLELCKIIAGQRYTKGLSRQQRQNQIAACKQGPTERQKICQNAMALNEYESDKLIQEFGLQFMNRLAVIKGRVLTPPQLEFGDGRTEEPREGRWNFNNKMMQGGVTIEKWAVAVFDGRCRDASNIASMLADCCCKRGMRMRAPSAVEIEPPRAQGMPAAERVQNMFAILAAVKPTFILCILPDKDCDVYVPFKKFCETKVGVTSQCMVKPRQLNDQYFGNLALKINLKLGGFNSPLTKQMTSILGVSTIIFGMDVSHGSPGDAESPSIAAVVATKNWPTVFHYATRARTQAPKLEMVEGLYEEVEGQKPGGMVKELLIEFYNTFKGPALLRKPSQIIVYRDGVSESQFEQCLELEVTAFKRACRSLDEDYNPGITFIVAQKRHNTRFFAQGGQTLRNGNVMPGTIVDKDVCHPHNYDFFLISQAGLIGTSRPTHYHVLYNENKYTPDDIQLLTNNLCYTFGRCTTAIAVAAPAAYAHLVATRYRKLVDTWGGSDTSSLRSSREGGGGGAPKPIVPLPQLKLKSHQSMFFC